MTSDRSRWTKKDYAEALDLALAERAEFKERVAALTEKLDEPIADPEARAIVTCAEVLDVLDRAERNQRSAGYSTANSSPIWQTSGYNNAVWRGPLTRVERVLEYLRTRYGLPDPEHELKVSMQRTADLSRDLEKAKQRLADIEGAISGQPPGVWR